MAATSLRMRQVLAIIFFAALASSAFAARLTQQEKQAALIRHNTCRCNVSPTASDMTAVVWDDKLEQVAQAFIDTCPSNHNPSATAQYKALGGSSWWVGENLAWGYASIGAAVDGWCNEAPNYNYATNRCSGGECGHYTQNVWRGTLRIGCASATNCPNWNGRYYVCNYADGGNVQGQRPYTQGTGNNPACTAAGLPQPGSQTTTTTTTTTTTKTTTKSGTCTRLTGSATASSEKSGKSASLAVDSSSSTFWQSKKKATAAKPQYLVFDLGKKKKVKSISVTFQRQSSTPSSYTLQISKDGSTYTTVATNKPTANPGSKARYVRVYATQSPNPIRISDLSVC